MFLSWALICAVWPQEKVKLGVMLECVRAKFTQNPELKKLLLSTGEAKLVEHTRNDRYWGTWETRLCVLLPGWSSQMSHRRRRRWHGQKQAGHHLDASAQGACGGISRSRRVVSVFPCQPSSRFERSSEDALMVARARREKAPVVLISTT